MTDKRQSLFPGVLRNHLKDLIKNRELDLSFSEFMQVVLYHPDAGYYAQPRKIGRSGDFYTSVSVGPCFGLLLARQIRQIVENFTDSPILVEQGAHDGQLAADILANLEAKTDYAIVEPKPAYREIQLANLGEKKLQQPSSLGEIRAETGIFLCNELLDAFPVDRYQWTGEKWREIRVSLDRSDEFCEILRDRSDVPAALPIDLELPEGFQTEFCPGIDDWLAQLYLIFEKGVFFLIDYGLSDSEFFEPNRTNGTFRCFRNHQATENPYEDLGETDITAHVNFSRVTRAAEVAGFEVLGLTDQNRFLTGIAADWLKELEAAGEIPRDLLGQFQTLTSPGSMGRNFRVLILGKGVEGLSLDGLKFG